MRLVYIFEQKNEAEEFYNRIHTKAKDKKIYVKLESSPYVRVELNQDQYFIFWKDIVQALIHVFILFHLPRVAKEILKKHYYYSDETEINHIIPILQSIMKYPKTYGTQTEIQAVHQLYLILEEDVKKDTMVYLKGFLDERSSKYMPLLVDVTGYAIDEWKREEDYQEFIHTLRNYIKKKPPLLNKLLITYDKELQLFNEYGIKITNNELKTILMEERLHFIDLFGQDFHMSAIISLAPSKIHIFTNNSLDPRILTLQNLYQENTIIEPIENFPFLSKKA